MSISKHSVYNVLGVAIPLATALVAIPLYLEAIGISRYGVLALVWLFLGYFGLFDLGLGRATAREIAAASSGETRTRIFWTSVALNIGLGVIGGLVLGAAAVFFFDNFFKVEGHLRAEVKASIPWLMLALPVATLSGVLTGALQGRQRFLEFNIISGLGTILFQLFPLVIAIFVTPDLRAVIPASIFARLLTMVALFVYCTRSLNTRAPCYDRKLANKLVRFGGWVSVTALVGPLMVIFDRFAIGAVFGSRAVGYYTVPFQLAERLSVVPSALASALFPRFSAHDSGDQDPLAREALKVLAVLTTPLAITGILLIGPFLELWISPEFAAQASLVGSIVFAGFWANGFATIPYVLLQSRGRPDLVAKCHAIELVPYMVILYFGLTTFGLAGAATAFSIRTALDFCLLAGLAGLLKRSLRMLLVPLTLIVAALAVSVGLSPNSIGWLAGVGAIAMITVAWCWSSAPHSLKSRLFTALNMLGRKSGLPR